MMEQQNISEERKAVHAAIKKAVFNLEHDNFKQKTLTSNQIIQKIKQIVEREVK